MTSLVWRSLLTVIILALVSCANAPGLPPTVNPTDSSGPAPHPTGAQTPTRGTRPVQPTSTAPGQPQTIAFVQSNKARAALAPAANADLPALVTGNNAFVWDLYQKVAQPKGNLFYSPYSISLALAMTYAGARDATEQQMAGTMHYTLPQNRLHPAFNNLDLTLAQRGQGAKGKDGQGFRLNIANALWGQQGYQFLPGFLDLLAQNYGAGLRLLDFAQAPEDSRVTINKWVSDQTENKIKDLIAPGTLVPATRLVLTNAIYFNAAWADQFKPEQTQDGPFDLLDGSQVTVPMMHQTASFGYTEGDGYQAVELPYDKNELSMVILLPQADKFQTFESTLDASHVATLVQNLKYKSVALTMSKFKFDSSFTLADALQALGMRDAFTYGPANFSGMDGTRNLFIGQVIHKAFAAVDEQGTEAAAATAVIMTAGAARPEPPVTVTIDRPFVFLIRDIQTGAILFVGRVVNPKA